MISKLRRPARSTILTSCALAALLTTSGIPDARALPVTATGVNWSFTLDEDELSAPAGSSIIFTGSIQNNTGFDLSIVGANIGFSLEEEEEEEGEEEEEIDIGLDLADDFLLTGGIIPIAGYVGPLFVVRWGDLEGEAEGTGIFELIADLPGDPASLSVEFEAELEEPAAVPVPSTLLLALLGSLGLRNQWRRRQP